MNDKELLAQVKKEIRTYKIIKNTYDAEIITDTRIYKVSTKDFKGIVLNKSKRRKVYMDLKDIYILTYLINGCKRNSV